MVFTFILNLHKLSTSQVSSSGAVGPLNLQIIKLSNKMTGLWEEFATTSPFHPLRQDPQAAPPLHLPPKNGTAKPYLLSPPAGRMV